MAANLLALSVVHPGLGQSVEPKLPHKAHILRTKTASVDTLGSLGYGGQPKINVGEELVGPFPCAYGPFESKDGDQVKTADGKVVVRPYKIVFRVEHGALIETGNRIRIGDRTFTVIVPPYAGSFDALAGALCQEIV